ncbi:MAG TPA: hypothetical protein VD902_07365 [Symbiobacteriaceae bacterium]|nr:hypothetical protein [Symbiobacteriaceae bacterium]
MKRIMVTFVLVGVVIFATSAIAAAENGPRWPVIRVHGVERAE